MEQSNHEPEPVINLTPEECQAEKTIRGLADELNDLIYFGSPAFVRAGEIAREIMYCAHAALHSKNFSTDKKALDAYIEALGEGSHGG